MPARIGLWFFFGLSFFIVCTFLAVDTSGISARKSTFPFDIVSFHLEPSPVKVQAADLYKAYLDNPQESEALYRDKRIFLSNIEVTDITVSYKLSGTDQLPFTSSFSSGNIKFKLSDPYLMQSVKPGFVLDIVGTCRGVSGEHLLIWDCWANGVVGKLSPGKTIYYGY